MRDKSSAHADVVSGRQADLEDHMTETGVAGIASPRVGGRSFESGCQA